MSKTVAVKHADLRAVNNPDFTLLKEFDNEEKVFLQVSYEDGTSMTHEVEFTNDSYGGVHRITGLSGRIGKLAKKLIDEGIPFEYY